jgi:hypothetical protein
MFDFESTDSVIGAAICASASGGATKKRQDNAVRERVIAAMRFGTHTGTKRRMGSPFARPITTQAWHRGESSMVDLHDCPEGR